MSNRLLNTGALVLVALALVLVGFKNYRPADAGEQLINVSYDPTRELYQDIDAQFSAQYEKQSGKKLTITQSHGGSSRQARAVADGLEADVVTLALPSDIEILRKRGLIADDWAKRLAHNAQPYQSTIVFVVRKGNPHQIRDWSDLIAPGVAIVTPNPKTSGNGKLSVLAAWGSVILAGGTEEQARHFLQQLFEHVADLGTGARDSTTTFVLGKEGDVHLTWENEAIRETAESKGDLEIVYPPRSIRAEPSVAWVDANVVHRKTGEAAKAYLEFLYTDAGQETIARHGYRPINADILKKHHDQLPDIDLFPISAIAKDWEDAQVKFFADNGIFDLIYKPKSK